MSNINSTPILVKALEVLRGAKINVDLVEKINKGRADILIGEVITQTYMGASDNLSQVMIRTPEGEDFTLTNNSDFKLDEKVFDNLPDTSLINRLANTYIKNINQYRVEFQNAARYGQSVALIYDRISNEIITLSIRSHMNIHANDNYTESALGVVCPTWPCGR